MFLFEDTLGLPANTLHQVTMKAFEQVFAKSDQDIGQVLRCASTSILLLTIPIHFSIVHYLYYLNPSSAMSA